MKIRKYFVANSSSASFVVHKDDVTALQATLIKNHSKEGAKYGILYPEDSWFISESDTKIEGYTSMDNFNMRLFMERIGIDVSKVEWNDNSCDWDEE